MKGLSIALALLLSIGALWAAEENLFPGPDFRSWAATAERHFESNAGENGAPGLVVERKDPQVFDFQMEKIQKPMKPNTRYEVSYRAMGKDISGLKLGAGIRLEFRKEGNWAGAFMRRGLYGSSDWRTFHFEVTTPADFDEVYVGFFMGMPEKQLENPLGYAVFCHPVIRELKPLWYVDLLNPPLRHALRAGRNRLIFNYAVVGGKDPADSLTAECTGAAVFTRQVPVKDGRFIIECDLPKGESTLKLSFGEFSRTFHLTAGQKPPANATWIDERGRWVRNGKPFLPVELYTNQACLTLENLGFVTTEEDIQLFLDSPFNMLREGMLTRLRFEGEADGVRWNQITPKTLANAKTLMDRIHAKGKTIGITAMHLNPKSRFMEAVGIEAVANAYLENFAKHPATAYWLLVDETDQSDQSTFVREYFARHDPWHPTIQAQYKTEAYGETIGGSDLFFMDNYPIYDENSTLEVVAKSMDSMQKHYSFNGGHISCGAIVQIFNWNNYNKNKPYYFPKEEQIRASVILEALSGIKAFEFYQRQWLREGVDHEGYLKRWAAACRIAQMLRDLEAYLVSDQDHPAFEMKVLQGSVRAQTFKTNDGRLALLVANAGNGEGIAEITFPGGEKLASQYGLTKFEGGKWLFKGTNAAGDVIK